ncbi:hypothetical protein HaLaN_00058 [Haematococcus lacustris]|uniref:Uncharacterized protein n=1 Tax=Haematococcus lacustris TaxID=44745 RepID=A0A699Y8A2_HAELA|nr:hypothetical protein HaLaN_00058 [Haematococcus lacustris]
MRGHKKCGSIGAGAHLSSLGLPFSPSLLTLFAWRGARTCVGMNNAEFTGLHSCSGPHHDYDKPFFAGFQSDDLYPGGDHEVTTSQTVLQQAQELDWVTLAVLAMWVYATMVPICKGVRHDEAFGERNQSLARHDRLEARGWMSGGQARCELQEGQGRSGRLVGQSLTHGIMHALT